MLPDTVQTLETRFGRIAYRTDGLETGTPLVLLQRYRGTMDDWDPDFVARLGRHHRLIRFDNAGIGWSEGQTPDNVAGMAEVAGAFLDGLELTEVDLLGWSLGGYVAQLLTLDRPGLVRRLIVAGSGPGGVTEAPPPHPAVDGMVLVPELSLKNLTFLFAADTESSREAQVTPQGRIDAVASSPLVSLEAAARQWKAILAFYAGGEDVRARLPELSLPVLVANGTHDLMIPSLNAFVISQEAPRAKLVLYPDAGHGFLFQHAEAFTEEVRAFLQV